MTIDSGKANFTPLELDLMEGRKYLKVIPAFLVAFPVSSQPNRLLIVSKIIQNLRLFCFCELIN